MEILEVVIAVTKNSSTVYDYLYLQREETS